MAGENMTKNRVSLCRSGRKNLTLYSMCYFVISRYSRYFKHMFLYWYLCGTVFVSRDERGNAELILLDHGLYDYLNDRDRVSLCQLYKAIILHDDYLMKHYSLQLGVHGKKNECMWLIFAVKQFSWFCL